MKLAKVKVEKCLDCDGEDAVKIKEFQDILKSVELPKEYLTEEYFFASPDNQFIYCHEFEGENIHIEVEEIIENEFWERIKTFLKRCGERLTQINKELKEHPMQEVFVSPWKGHVVFLLKTELESMKQDSIATLPIIETEKIFNREGEESYRVTSWSNIIRRPLPSEVMGKVFERYQQGDCFYLVKSENTNMSFISIPETANHQGYTIQISDMYPAALWEQGIEYMRKCVKRYEAIQEEESQPQEEIFEI